MTHFSKPDARSKRHLSHSHTSPGICICDARKHVESVAIRRRDLRDCATNAVLSAVGVEERGRERGRIPGASSTRQPCEGGHQLRCKAVGGPTLRGGACNRPSCATALVTPEMDLRHALPLERRAASENRPQMRWRLSPSSLTGSRRFGRAEASSYPGRKCDTGLLSHHLFPSHRWKLAAADLLGETHTPTEGLRSA